MQELFLKKFAVFTLQYFLLVALLQRKGENRFMILAPFVRVVPDDDYAILERIDFLNGSGLSARIEFS